MPKKKSTKKKSPNRKPSHLSETCGKLTKAGKTCTQKVPTDRCKYHGKKTRKNKKKSSQAKRPTKKEELLIAERRNRVLDLKRNGASVRQISRQLLSEDYKRASVGTVQSDIAHILTKLHDEQGLSAQQWQALMVDRLEDQRRRVTTSMIKTDENEENAYLESDPEKERVLLLNHEKLDKMVGASKSERAKNNLRESLAELMGVPVEEIPDDTQMD